MNNPSLNSWLKWMKMQSYSKCENSTLVNPIILNEKHPRVTRLDLKWPVWTSTWPFFKNSNIYNWNNFHKIPNESAETFKDHFRNNEWIRQSANLQVSKIVKTDWRLLVIMKHLYLSNGVHFLSTSWQSRVFQKTILMSCIIHNL